MKKQVEILAPAGSFESMRAAAAAGADAVYIGGSRFGARAFADNLDEEKMLEAIDYMHLHGRKIYMTVNTLVKEKELEDLYAYLLPYYKRGLDAVIVQDMGVFAYMKEHFPMLPIHASTQMTVTGSPGARLLLEMGAARIVTARELSIEEISKIREETGAEIESFVHGALCYCYSGQCLFSSLIGGRSGNRGRCAQTCRLPFEVKRDGKTLNNKDERYVLSLKDLCTLDILPELIEAGIYSMKIEGRMKSPRYTAGVVSIYRKYVDLWLEKGRSGYRVEDKDRKMLLELFDRGGQTEGYYRQHNSRDMVVLKEKPAFRQENRELYDYLDQTYVESVLKEAVTGTVAAEEGKPLSITLKSNDTEILLTGAVVQTAKNQPMSEEKIAKQIGKTGSTPFEFTELHIETAGNCFIPVQELNELRRAAFDKLTVEILRPYQRELPQITGGTVGKTAISPLGEERETISLNVSLEKPDFLRTVLEEPSVSSVYIDSTGFAAGDWAQTVHLCHEKGKQCLLILPHIYRQEAAGYFDQNKEKLLKAGFDGSVVRAYEEIELMKEWAPRLPIVFDYGIYTMNSRAEAMIRRMSPEQEARFTLPIEANSRELKALSGPNKELIAYGYMPVMVTAQCMRRTMEGCSKRPELLMMKDRMGKEFPVINHCRFCYNTVYNCTALSLLQEADLIEQLKPSSLRLQFTMEDGARIKNVIRAFAGRFLEGKSTELSGEFTKGHFKRGVE